MASAPSYDSFQVQPNGPVQPPYRPPLRVPSDQGFEQPAQQAERMGQALSATSGQIGDIAIDKANQANQIQVINAENQAREVAQHLQFDPQEGYTNVKGGDVMKTGPNGVPLAVDYTQRYQQSLDQIGSTLTNPAQKQAFATSAAALRTSFEQGALQHENAEYHSYQESVVGGAADLTVQEIANNPNPAFIDQRLPILDASVARLGQLKGVSGNEITALQNTARSRALGQGIKSLIASGDIANATALYQRYGPQMLATDKDEIEQPLRREQTAQTGMTYGDRVMALVDGQPTGNTPPLPVAPGGRLDPATAWSFIARHEGGYAAHDANGAPVNFGINQSANPGVDVKNLTASQAQQIFQQKYWSKSGAADLPAGLALMHADTYYINPKRATQFLQQADGDPAKYMQLRQAWMQSLVQSDPDKYGKYANAWANRNRDLAAAAGSVQGGAGTDPNTGKPSMTLETAINTGVSMLYADHPDATPEMRQAVEQRVEAQYRVRLESAGQKIDQSLASVYNTLHSNGGDLGALTPSQRAAIPGEKWESVQAFARETQASAGRTQTDPGTYEALFGHPQLLGTMTDSQLLALRPKLSEGDFQTAVRERATMHQKSSNPDAKNNSGHIDFNAVNNIVNQRLTSLGINPHPAAKDGDGLAHIGTIRNAINDAVLSQQSRIGRPLNDAELSAAIDQQFMKQSFSRPTTFLGVTTGQAAPHPRFTTAKPSELSDHERQGIEDGLRRRGVPVTPENTMRVFYEKR
jgi:soluble lytic murein transglycosylase